LRTLKWILALWAGLTASGAFAAGQEVVPGSGTDQAVSSQGNEIPESPATSPEPTVAPNGSPATLDELIPQSAVADPESWAGEGVTPATQDLLMSDPADIAAAIDLGENDTIIPDGLSNFDIETALGALSIPTPDQLEPDPDLPELAQMDGPDLIDLPELEALAVSDQLVLAFPADKESFPEKSDFVERFRALSSIEALGSGEATIPQLAARARSDEELLTQMLRTYGYYNAEVARQLSGGRRGFADQERDDARRAADTEPRVRFDILPGERYRFGAIDLGALVALSEPDASDLRDIFAIRPGDPLYADRIVERDLSLRAALGESGYPFANLDAPELLIDHAREEGDLTLLVQPNGKYNFGGVVSSDPDFLSGRHLARIARFDAGETYRASLQSDLRRAVLATGLVSNVAISARETSAPTNGEPGEVALDVEFERAPLRTISGALGYGTEDGLKLEGRWEHRNLFPPEGSLAVRGIVGTREQLASVGYRRNNFRARDQILTADVYASDIKTEAVDARTAGLRGSFERVSNLLFQKPFAWQVGAEVLYTDERNRTVRSAPGVPRPRQTYTIAGLFGRATIDSSDDLLDPTTGYRLTGFLAPEASRSLGAESFYLRAQGDASYYHQLGGTVLAGRVRGATIQGADVIEIAPSRRLYAGGGGSVRGYGFQGIGPRSESGEPTGGGSLVELALEARIQTGFLDGAIEVVPFLDAGSVATGSRPDFNQVRFGAGIGIRYKTSFGPIRVDVGVPLNPNEFDAPVVVYVSLGQAF
jgi:translocation and assembly module TamA